jgi:tetratricopeptide (TPR) repeat protein
VIPGLVSAFFFLFLPINANSVLYAYALSDILMTFFMLSALYLLSKNIKTSTLNFALIIFLFSCALLSKQSAVIFPALLIFTDLLFGIEIAKRRLHYITIFIITFLYLLGRYMFFGGIGDLEAVGQTFDQQDYLFVQGIMILKYLCLAVFPYGFAIDHTYLPQDFNALEKLMAWILILVPCSVSLFYVASKKSNVFVRLASWFCIFFVIALLPVSSFLPTVDLFVERRSYLSTIALVSMIGLFATLLLNTQKRNLRKLIVISFLTSILVLFSFITWNRTTLFGSPQNLWEEAFALYPQSKRIRVNLGTAYIDSNQLSEAKFLFESVAHDYPSDAFAFSSLGLIYQDTRFKGYNLRSALISYQRALELAPNDLVILYNFGVLMLGMGNLEKADSTFRQVLNLNPRFAYAMLGLGNTLIKNGNTVEGAKYLQDALKVDPQVPGAREQLLLLKK